MVRLWLVAGFLCWLHVKYYAPSVVLAAIGAWQLRRDPTRFRPATHAFFGALFLTGPALFAAFSVPAFGDVLGGRGGAELNRDISRGFELALGLHLDQVNGLFVQQPLLLPGLVALGWMIRRRHPLTVPWLVLYASLIVPNALQRIPYGGAAAPAGRFAWSAMWLWLVPLGIAGREALHRETLPRAAWIGVFAAVAYQAALAVWWLPEPQRLFNGLYPPGMWQPSLFAPSVMLSLPKLGSHADVSYLPNVIWTLGALALLVAGLLYRSKLRHLPVVAAAVLGVLVLPVDDVLERSRTVPRRFEAEHLPFYCTVRSQAGASNGRVCRQNSERRFAVTGPFISLDPGAYEVVAAIGGYEGPAANGVLQVVAGRAHYFIARRNFRLPESLGESLVTLPFHVERTLHDVEFRLRGAPDLDIDYLELRHGPCLGERGPVRVRLQARSGLFLSAQPAPGGAVRADRDVAGQWERFVLTGAFGDCLESGETVFVRTTGNAYLRADRGDGSIVVASEGNAAEHWERFRLHRREGGGPIRSGDHVTLQTARGYSVVAERGGDVRADSARAGPWASFRITVVPGR